MVFIAQFSVSSNQNKYNITVIKNNQMNAKYEQNRTWYNPKQNQQFKSKPDL